jgi:peptide/nickel transport system permease protein
MEGGLPGSSASSRWKGQQPDNAARGGSAVTQYILKRLLGLIPLLLVVSVLSFIIIQLPPGDFLSTYILQLEQRGTFVSDSEVARLKQQYDLDRPVYVQYMRWMWNIVSRGDFGISFQYNRPVSQLIGERLGLTIAMSMIALLLTYLLAIPIGVYSAVRKNSLFDYTFTFVGFIGIAVPNFLLALVLMWLSFAYLNVPVTGLFSTAFADAPWSAGKVADLFKHIWLPIAIISLSGTAGIIRIMRSGVLDELSKQYVITARAKGLKESRLVVKYPVRVALNPIVSTAGWLLPQFISGESIVAIVLNLPTTGPLLLNALLAQDMYLAGSFIMILSTLTVVGTVLSDIFLTFLDPRIRFERVAR